MNRRYTSRVELVLLAALLIACPEGQVTQTARGDILELTGVDACIEKLNVTLTQGSLQKSVSLTLSSGDGSANLGSSGAVDWSQPVVVTARITKVVETDDCLEQTDTNQLYSFEGVVTSTADNVYTIPSSRFIIHTGTEVEDTGTVHGGRREQDDEARIALWFDLDSLATCTAVCWEQWAETRLFHVQGPNLTELQNGQPWTDRFGNPQVYGQFGRDKPLATTNCFREDPIPGVAGAKGILDAPGLPPDATNATAVYQAARPRINQRHFTLRYAFDMRSILWCEQPPPREILGYYTWTVTQDWVYYDDNGQLSWRVDYDISDPTWTAGSDGLPPQMR